jgi:hypothetical protein
VNGDSFSLTAFFVARTKEEAEVEAVMVKNRKKNSCSDFRLKHGEVAQSRPANTLRSEAMLAILLWWWWCLFWSTMGFLMI